MNTNAPGADMEFAPAPDVELRPNTRSKLRCECGSGRPTVWLLDVGGDRRECCYGCFEAAWFAATEAAFL